MPRHKRPDVYFFHRLLKLKELHAKRREAKELELEGLADAVEKLGAKELWAHGPTATEFIPEGAIDAFGLEVGGPRETD